MAKITLDRTFIHNGKWLGPGEVEVSEEVAADLKTAQVRIQKQDAEHLALRMGGMNPAQPPAVSRDSVTYTKAAVESQADDSEGSKKDKARVAKP